MKPTSNGTPQKAVIPSEPVVVGDGPVEPSKLAVAHLHPLGLAEVVLSKDCDLGAWQRRNSVKTIPHCIEQVLAAGAARNLENVADGRIDLPHEGLHFSDSDIYKVLEATAWDGVRGRSDGVENFIEKVTHLLRRAQRKDGYIDTWFQGQKPELVWKDLRWGHELYCAGHLLQATIAFQRTDRGSDLFEVSDKLVEHLLSIFSVEDGDGRLLGVCGHPLIETALVEFYRLTGDVRVLNLAKRQIDLRGRPDVALPTSGLLGDSRFPLSYFLHHMPVRKRSSATGHAVRELYLQAGVVDVAVETQDYELLSASEAIWDDLYLTKTYVTGAHGSRHRGESIGDPYELPSDRAYGETCAAIASFQWNWRLLLATGRARYAEAMQRALWNTIAGAVSRKGTEFFYSNTLHLRTGHDGADEDSPSHRLPWYQCSCCPPNLARLLASIQAYLVTRDASGLQVHMPFSGTVSTAVPGGTVDLDLRTGHPWAGDTEVEVRSCSSGEPWRLSFLLPDRKDDEGTRVTVNGYSVEASWNDSYVTVSRKWKSGDRLGISGEVPIRVLRPHWRVDAARNSVAIKRGPLVYCLEAQDLDDSTAIEDVVLERVLQAADDVPTDLEGYVKVVVHASGQRVFGPASPLYDIEGSRAVNTEPLPLTFVPYFARGNRALTAMRVWIPPSSEAGVE